MYDVRLMHMMLHVFRAPTPPLQAGIAPSVLCLPHAVTYLFDIVGIAVVMMLNIS
jgi:hypothetical protein